jgi:hypothetical protein
VWGPLTGVERGRGGERWRGVVLAWVRDRGEHYLLRPLLLDGTTVLTVDSLLFISLFQFLCPFSVAVPFPFVFFGLFPYRLLKSVFRCQASLTLTVFRAVSTRLPERRDRAYNLRVALTRLPWRRYRAYSLRVALTRLPGHRYRAYNLRVALTRLIYLLYIYIFLFRGSFCPFRCAASSFLDLDPCSSFQFSSYK